MNDTENKSMSFAFGDPEPILDGYDFFDSVGTMLVDGYYEPPFSMTTLYKLTKAQAHHRSALQVKANIIASCLKPNTKLKTADFKAFVMDVMTLGNGYLQQIENRLGQLVRLEHRMAMHVRRMEKPGQYLMLRPDGQKFTFREGTIIHFKEYDLLQDIYGVPEYLAALQSILLNENATLFRRKYYVNGAHAGFIMYLTDSGVDTQDVDAMKNAFKQAKGPGNFKNLFLHSPNGEKDGLKVMPISEVAAKDEFMNIKGCSRDDVLAAHRVPPQMMGIIPTNTAGFGSAKDAAIVFNRNELVPLKNSFKEINQLVGEEVIDFDPYEIEATSD